MNEEFTDFELILKEHNKEEGIYHYNVKCKYNGEDYIVTIPVIDGIVPGGAEITTDSDKQKMFNIAAKYLKQQYPQLTKST